MLAEVWMAMQRSQRRTISGDVRLFSPMRVSSSFWDPFQSIVITGDEASTAKIAGAMMEDI